MKVCIDRGTLATTVPNHINMSFGGVLGRFSLLLSVITVEQYAPTEQFS